MTYATFDLLKALVKCRFDAREATAKTKKGFYFGNDGAGSTTVELIEHRPWEPNSTINTFTLTANVTAE